MVTLFLLFAKEKVDNNEDKCLGKSFSLIVENKLLWKVSVGYKNSCCTFMNDFIFFQ